MPNGPRISRIRVFFAAALLALGGLAAWEVAIEPHVVPKRFGVVADGAVYRSGELTPGATRRVQERHGIRTIVDLGAHKPGSVEEMRAAKTAESLGISRVRFNLEGDATGNPNSYVAALRIMTDPERQPVLVHCGAGTERTGCAVILYRHMVEGVPLEEAYAEAVAAGHDPARNPHLRRVLDAYAGPIVDACRSGGWIPDVEPPSFEATERGGEGAREGQDR